MVATRASASSARDCSHCFGAALRAPHIVQTHAHGSDVSCATGPCASNGTALTPGVLASRYSGSRQNGFAATQPVQPARPLSRNSCRADSVLSSPSSAMRLSTLGALVNWISR